MCGATPYWPEVDETGQINRTWLPYELFNILFDHTDGYGPSGCPYLAAVT